MKNLTFWKDVAFWLVVLPIIVGLAHFVIDGWRTLLLAI